MIEDDAAQVLAFAEHAGVPRDRLDAIRDGDRRSYMALLDAILATHSGLSPCWAGATLREEDVGADQGRRPASVRASGVPGP